MVKRIRVFQNVECPKQEQLLGRPKIDTKNVLYGIGWNKHNFIELSS